LSPGTEWKANYVAREPCKTVDEWVAQCDLENYGGWRSETRVFSSGDCSAGLPAGVQLIMAHSGGNLRQYALIVLADSAYGGMYPQSDPHCDLGLSVSLVPILYGRAEHRAAIEAFAKQAGFRIVGEYYD
jgi:hypothetical protein